MRADVPALLRGPHADQRARPLSGRRADLGAQTNFRANVQDLTLYI